MPVYRKKPVRKKRLLRHVALIVLITFTVIMVLIGTLVYQGSKKLYLEAKNDMITRDLIRISRTVQKGAETFWMLEYCVEHPEEMQSFKTDEEELTFLTFLVECGEDSTKYFSPATMKKLKNASPEIQRAAARCLFYEFAISFELEGYTTYYDELYCIDIGDKNRGFVYYGIDNKVDSLSTFCQTWDYPLEKHPAAQQVMEKGFITGFEETYFEEAQIDPSDDNVIYHIGYIPLADDTATVVICIAYDWSSFRTALIPYFVYIGLAGLVIMLITGGALLHFLHRSAIRPLRKIQDGVRCYVYDKDSEKIIAAMSEIKAKNEFGVLSDDIAELAEEIERYTQDNIALASEKEKVEAELGLAAKIQSDMLPKKFIEPPQGSRCASMDPAKEVGGDFYDFFMIDEDHLGLVIADVSGKGVPASLFMMMSMIVIRNLARAGKSPAEVLRKSNRSICENNNDSMFVTVWFGVLDIRNGHVIASNAGHEYPMIRKANGDFELFKDKHGFVLGAMPGMKYKEYEFDIEAGGTLFVYTDGAPEATDVNEQLFGTERMLEALNQDPDAAPDQLLQNMTDAIDAFVGEAPQFDDLTMLCVKYHGNQQDDQQENQQGDQPKE